jgi:hypothetical protein
MHFVMGLVMIWIAYRLLKPSTPTVSPYDVAQRQLKEQQERHNESLKRITEALTSYMERKEQDHTPELNLRVAEDAIAREERAKASLVAVLKAIGATEDAIQHVLDIVEGGRT